MRALLISTYELGRQPYGLASPAAWLRRAGWDVVCADVTRERLQRASIEAADLVGFHLPMHTATRLAGPVIRKVREINPSARVCAYGLYAPLNGDWLRSIGVDAVFGGEFEEELTTYAAGANGGSRSAPGAAAPADSLPRARSQRAAAARRSTPCFTWATGGRRSSDRRRPAAGASTSAGTVRWCRSIAGSSASCQPESSWRTSMPRSQAGAEHITFGDPDFFNGPTHAMRVVDALHAAHPDVTYDVTIKVEHLLRHRDLLPRLARTGCAFVTSAVESIDDAVLRMLREGPHPQDFVDAVAAVPRGGPDVRPDVRGVPPMAHARRLLRSARLDRSARSRRPRRADPAGDSPADPRRVAPARTGRHARANRAVRRGHACVSAGCTPIPGSTSCSARSRAGRRAGRRRSPGDVRRRSRPAHERAGSARAGRPDRGASGRSCRS